MFFEECTTEEIRVYKKLEDEIFDFGEGPMKIEGIYNSEDNYYNLSLKNREKKYREKFKENKEEKKEKEERTVNRYKLNKKHNNKLKNLQGKVWWAVRDQGTHLKRDYLSPSSTHLKRASSKRVRRHNKELSNGKEYKKLFDIWWQIL